tara:strand:- start:9778 stop:10224 length:447 start_codon:yes stop_codon:yes gene_type:complete
MPDARDFLRPSTTAGTEDLEFTNTAGGEAIFIMRANGAPSSSADTKAVLNYGYAVGNFVSRQQHFSGSQSSSAHVGTGAIYNVNLKATGSQQVNSDTLEVFLNGLSINHTTDFYLSGSNKVLIKYQSANGGYNIVSSDKIKIKYQQGF